MCKTYVKGRTSHIEVIREYFQKVLNHVRKNFHHTSSKCGRHIAQPKWYSLGGKSAKKACKSRLLLVIRDIYIHFAYMLKFSYVVEFGECL